MKKPHLFSALVLGVAVAVAGQAHAQEKDRDRGMAGTGTAGEAKPAKRESIQVEGATSDFGAPAQIVVSQEFGASIAFDNRGPDNQVLLNVSPSLDYFILENISVGAEVSLAVNIGEGDDNLDIGVFGRAGYALPLREAISLWPRLGLGFRRRPVAVAVGGESNTDTDFAITAFVPALLHITPNFFLGAGPDLNIIPGGDNSGFTLALRTTLGGNF